MKNIQKFWVQGCTKIIHGLAAKFTLALLGAAFALSMGEPISVKATEGITQLEFIQWVVQISGESGKFNASSTAADFLQWAQSKGISPAGGWKPTTKLTRQVLAQTLVQLLNLTTSSKDAADYERILAREGIVLPDEPVISRGIITSFLDGNIFPRIPNSGSPVRHTNNGFGNGDQPPPPHNPNGNPHANPPGNSGNAPGHNN